MINKLEKAELQELGFDELIKKHVYFGVLERLEYLTEEGEKEGFDISNKNVCYSKKKKTLSEYIDGFVLTNKNNKELLSVIIQDEFGKSNFKEIYEENTNDISKSLDYLLRTNFFKECLSDDDAVYFKQLFHDAFLTLTVEGASLSLIKPYEREFYFQEVSKSKVEMLSRYIMIQSKIGRVHRFRNDSLLRKSGDLTIIESVVKKASEVKESQQGISFKSRIKSVFKSDAAKKEEHELDYESAIEYIDYLLMSYMDIVLNVLLLNSSLNRDSKILSYEKNAQMSKKVFDYLTTISKNIVMRFDLELDSAPLDDVVKRDEKLLKSLYISNILKSQDKIKSETEEILFEKFK